MGRTARAAGRAAFPQRFLTGIAGALCLAALAFPASAGEGAPAEDVPARDLFGAAEAPADADLTSRAIGAYARGCLAGGRQLAIDGPSWQAMRLTRNRHWGHPALIAFVEELAETARAEDDWPGLLVGDLSQPRGGPMPTGHTSHQIGLDADIWLTPMPDRRLDEEERETIGATSMVDAETRRIDPDSWSDEHGRLIRRAAISDEVARIFVHPGIKKAMCEAEWEDRAFLRKVRPWWGHDSHFHIRLACPEGAEGCTDQTPPPAGTGCGAELDWWLSDEPWTPQDPPPPPAEPLKLADLPDMCREVLVAR